MSNIKVFISFYHDDDQRFKDELIRLNDEYHMFIDNSVDTGDIDDSQMTDEQIRIKIRDDYIKDTDGLLGEKDSPADASEEDFQKLLTLLTHKL